MDLFISLFWSRFRLQNGYVTQRDVCVVIVQCSRSRPCRVCVGGVFFMRARISCVPCIISLLILSTCHRGYTLADLFISLDFDSKMVARATQRDVCVVIVQCSRPEDVPDAFI